MIKTASVITEEISQATSQESIECLITEQLKLRNRTQAVLLIEKLLENSDQTIKEALVNTMTWRNQNKAKEILMQIRR